MKKQNLIILLAILVASAAIIATAYGLNNFRTSEQNNNNGQVTETPSINQEQTEISTINEDQIINYITENINEISPEPPVLGGTFYPTSIDFTDNDTVIIEYEDGHIALSAEAKFNALPDGTVEVVSFDLRDDEVIENDRRFEEEIGANDDFSCIDLCGDGICQEMVCMGEGCPCAETPESCPEDCQE